MRQPLNSRLAVVVAVVGAEIVELELGLAVERSPVAC
jgi:hypothetical protein